MPGKLCALYLAIAVACLSCNAQPKLATENSPATLNEYQWVKVIDSALFAKSYNFQLFALRDSLWAFHPDGNFYSTDGKVWRKSYLTNSIYNLAFLDYVYFNNAMYGLGHFEGNIEQFSFKPIIYKSSDLKSWETISTDSNIPNRFFYHPYIFNEKIWIAGGMNNDSIYTDLWNSADGIHWDKVGDNMPFGKRHSSLIVEFKGKIYLLNNDVWSSGDGMVWKEEVREIVPGVELFGYTAVVYDDQIWLLGCSRNGNFSSKVLTSRDGQIWNEMDAPWSPRGGVAACVFKGKIYLTGGKYGGLNTANPEFEYSNDVWYLEKINSSISSGNSVIGH